MSKYIGQKTIVEYNELDGKVQFTLNDGSGDIVTKSQFESIAKDQAYDDGMIRVYKWNTALSKIMAILLENDMKLIEKDFIMSRVDETIISNYRKASAMLFGAKDEALITLSQIDKVLIGNNNPVESTPEVTQV